MKPYYQDSNCTIYNGDSFEILPVLDQNIIDIIVTDMPFSDYTHKNAKSNKGDGRGKKAINFDSISEKQIRNFLSIADRICNRWIVSFMDWRHIARLECEPHDSFELIRFGIWQKTNPMPQISADRPAHGWDGIAYLHKKTEKKFWNDGGKHGNFYSPIHTSKTHPTEKPVWLMRKLIENFYHESYHAHDADVVILDPFMGTGATLVAAKELGIKAIGIELQKGYCDIAVSRLRQEGLFNAAKQETDSDVPLDEVARSVLG